MHHPHSQEQVGLLCLLWTLFKTDSPRNSSALGNLGQLVYPVVHLSAALKTCLEFRMLQDGEGGYPCAGTA